MDSRGSRTDHGRLAILAWPARPLDGTVRALHEAHASGAVIARGAFFFGQTTGGDPMLHYDGDKPKDPDRVENRDDVSALWIVQDAVDRGRL